MIEFRLIEYLIQQGIDRIGSRVYAETPEDPPSEYILIEKTGSRIQNGIHMATFAIQSISSDRQNGLRTVMLINEDVKERMSHFAEEPDIYSCKLISDHNFTNTTTKQHRYQAVYNIFF